MLWTYHFKKNCGAEIEGKKKWQIDFRQCRGKKKWQIDLWQ